MDISRLSEIPLFEGMTEHELEDIVYGGASSPRLFNKGSTICREGREIHGLHVLCEGTARTLMRNNGGKSVTIEMLHAPTAFATALAFATDNSSPVDVVAETNCEVIVIGRDRLLQLMGKHKRLMLGILRNNADRSAFLTQRLREFALNDLKTRIRNYIKQNGPIRNQTEVAKLLGVARPSLSRALNEIEREKNPTEA